MDNVAKQSKLDYAEPPVKSDKKEYCYICEGEIFRGEDAWKAKKRKEAEELFNEIIKGKKTKTNEEDKTEHLTKIMSRDNIKTSSSSDFAFVSKVTGTEKNHKLTINYQDKSHAHRKVEAVAAGNDEFSIFGTKIAAGRFAGKLEGEGIAEWFKKQNEYSTDEKRDTYLAGTARGNLKLKGCASGELSIFKAKAQVAGEFDAKGDIDGCIYEKHQYNKTDKKGISLKCVNVNMHASMKASGCAEVQFRSKKNLLRGEGKVNLSKDVSMKVLDTSASVSSQNVKANLQLLYAKAEGSASFKGGIAFGDKELRVDAQAKGEAVSSVADCKVNFKIKKKKSGFHVPGVRLNFLQVKAKGKLKMNPKCSSNLRRRQQTQNAKSILTHFTRNLCDVKLCTANIDLEKKSGSRKTLRFKSRIAEGRFFTATVVGKKKGNEEIISFEKTGVKMNAGNVQVTGCDERRIITASKQEVKASFDTGNIKISGLGKKGCSANATDSSGVQCFNIGVGINRSFNIETSQGAQKSFCNLYLNFGLPSIKFGLGLGNFGIPFLGNSEGEGGNKGEGGASGSGGTSNDCNQNGGRENGVNCDKAEGSGKTNFFSYKRGSDFRGKYYSDDDTESDESNNQSDNDSSKTDSSKNPSKQRCVFKAENKAISHRDRCDITSGDCYQSTTREGKELDGRDKQGDCDMTEGCSDQLWRNKYGSAGRRHSRDIGFYDQESACQAGNFDDNDNIVNNFSSEHAENKENSNKSWFGLKQGRGSVEVPALGGPSDRGVMSSEENQFDGKSCVGNSRVLGRFEQEPEGQAECTDNEETLRQSCVHVRKGFDSFGVPFLRSSSDDCVKSIDKSQQLGNSSRTSGFGLDCNHSSSHDVDCCNETKFGLGSSNIGIPFLGNSKGKGGYKGESYTSGSGGTSNDCNQNGGVNCDTAEGSGETNFSSYKRGSDFRGKYYSDDDTESDESNNQSDNDNSKTDSSETPSKQKSTFKEENKAISHRDKRGITSRDCYQSTTREGDCDMAEGCNDQLWRNKYGSAGRRNSRDIGFSDQESACKAGNFDDDDNIVNNFSSEHAENKENSNRSWFGLKQGCGSVEVPALGRTSDRGVKSSEENQFDGKSCVGNSRVLGRFEQEPEGQAEYTDNEETMRQSCFHVRKGFGSFGVPFLRSNSDDCVQSIDKSQQLGNSSRTSGFGLDCNHSSLQDVDCCNETKNGDKKDLCADEKAERYDKDRNYDNTVSIQNLSLSGRHSLKSCDCSEKEKAMEETCDSRKFLDKSGDRMDITTRPDSLLSSVHNVEGSKQKTFFSDSVANDRLFFRKRKGNRISSASEVEDKLTSKGNLSANQVENSEEDRSKDPPSKWNESDYNKYLYQLVAEKFNYDTDAKSQVTSMSSEYKMFDWSDTKKVKDDIVNLYKSPQFSVRDGTKDNQCTNNIKSYDDKMSEESENERENKSKGSEMSIMKQPIQDHFQGNGSLSTGNEEINNEKQQRKRTTKDPPKKPFGEHSNIHTIFTISGGDTRPIKYLKDNVACFGDED